MLVIGPWAVIAGAYAYLVLACARRVETETGDFRHFYDAARAMLAHEDIYRSGTGGYIYPPLLAFLYLPLARLSRGAAAAVSLGVNVGLVLSATLILAAACRDRWRAWATIGPGPSGGAAVGTSVGTIARPPRALAVGLVSAITTLVMLDKIKGELQMWQTNAILLFACSACLYWLDRRPLLAGAWLGLAINIKYLPIVLLPWMVARGRWRAAAGVVVGIAAFAVLPAAWTGLDRNLGDLRVAFAGILRLVGVPVESQAANVEPLAVSFSVSVTSALARLFGDGRSGAALAASAAVAVCFGAVVIAMYLRSRLPLFGRAAASPDSAWAALHAVEFAGLLVVALAFSPQTNPRHLVLITPFAAASAAAVLSYPRGDAFGRRARLAVLAALLVLVGGLNLPPGVPSLKGIVDAWRSIGGTSWTSLIALILVLSVCIRVVRLQTARPERILPVQSQ